MDVKKLNTTSLAYIGDAVYEVYIRKYVMRDDAAHTDALHKRAIAFVRADGQAYCIKRLIKERESENAGDGAEIRAFVLTDEEISLVKRARNRKSVTKPKNVDPITYKWATAFEALVGHLYLTGQTERLDLFAETAIAYIENGLRQ